MNIFISSLITGMEAEREAVKRAITALGHRAVMAEDFGATAGSPQIVCLEGVRKADVFVLIVGRRYGSAQPSGISATHEEYREAREKRPVLVFVEDTPDREPLQVAMLKEVQNWEAGLFTAPFKTPAELNAAVTRALHEWILSSAAAAPDATDMLPRLMAAFPSHHPGHSAGNALELAVAGSPRLTVLRPAELEDPSFGAQLLQSALFGSHRIFDMGKGSKIEVTDHILSLTQEGGRAAGSAVSVSEQGDVFLSLSLAPSDGLPVVIEEEVRRKLGDALGFAVEVLDRIDPTHRLRHTGLAVHIRSAGFLAWRSTVEHARNPSSVSMGFGQEEKKPVHLSPPHRVRTALTHDRARLVDDLLVLLRRQWKG